VDQAHDLVAVLAVVAVIDLADQPAGVNARDDRAAPRDVVGAAAEVLLQRDRDCYCFDFFDAHDEFVAQAPRLPQ
jgi:hypothetical protein